MYAISFHVDIKFSSKFPLSLFLASVNFRYINSSLSFINFINSSTDPVLLANCQTPNEAPPLSFGFNPIAPGSPLDSSLADM